MYALFSIEHIFGVKSQGETCARNKVMSIPALCLRERQLPGIKFCVLIETVEACSPREPLRFGQDLCDPSSAFFGFMGLSSAIIFANLGAAYGTAKSGVGIMSMGVMGPDMVCEYTFTEQGSIGSA